MGKIFKNMLPYWKAVIIIIALLFVQAWCDLSLPSYTSDIIDVGIQNSGVEHIVPEKLTADEFDTAQFIMTDDEADLWKGLYKADGEFYKLKDKSSKELDEADEKLNLPLIMNYQMSTELENVSVEQLGESLGVKLKSFKQEKEDDDGNKVKVDCVDARPFFAGMTQSGKMDKKSILSMRDKMSDTIDAMGSSLVKSMGVAYAVSSDKAAGIDVDHIQKSYLLFAGLKMLGMALLMGVVTVLVGFFASRVGAGIGMTLREKVFKNVVGFSNAEMDKFNCITYHEKYK